MARGIPRATCTAMSRAESSGIVAMSKPAAAREAKAPPNRAVGGTFKAVAATGSKAGDRSIAFATSGRMLSLEASKTPIRSFSSANFKRGAAEERVKPAFSSRVRSPN